MLVKRFQDAKPCEVPDHRGVTGLRLQGFEEGGPTRPWLGYSQFLPSGVAGQDSTPFEKVYLVLDGEMTVITGGHPLRHKIGCRYLVPRPSRGDTATDCGITRKPSVKRVFS